jgi:hypothetical protein
MDVVDPFDVEVRTDHGMSEIIPVSGLSAGAVQGIAVTLGPGDNCYNPNCEVTATVDISDVIAESDETNNEDARLDLG